MKTVRALRLGMKDFLMMSQSRQRPHLKRPNWTILVVCLVSIFLIGVYIYPPRNSAACYLFPSSGCLYEQRPPVLFRELTDEETAAQVVFKEILRTPIKPKKSKIAFLFLTPGALPFEMLWHKFFEVSFCFLITKGVFDIKVGK